MMGLLLKDLYTLKQYWKSFVLIAIIFFVLFSTASSSPIPFIEGAFIMFAMMITINTFSLDNLAKWDQYALSLPIKRKTIVKEKYILTLLACGAGTLVSFLISYVHGTFLNASRFNMSEHLLFTEIIVSLFLFFFSILLPLTFRFGVEKSRLFLFVLFASPAFLVTGLSTSGIPIPSEATIIKIGLFSPIIGFVFYAVSYILSVRIFEKREF